MGGRHRGCARDIVGAWCRAGDCGWAGGIADAARDIVGAWCCTWLLELSCPISESIRPRTAAPEQLNDDLGAPGPLFLGDRGRERGPGARHRRFCRRMDSWAGRPSISLHRWRRAQPHAPNELRTCSRRGQSLGPLEPAPLARGATARAKRVAHLRQARRTPLGHSRLRTPDERRTP